jgi:hypothetical protein
LDEVGFADQVALPARAGPTIAKETREKIAAETNVEIALRTDPLFGAGDYSDAPSKINPFFEPVARFRFSSSSIFASDKQLTQPVKAF